MKHFEESKWSFRSLIAGACVITVAWAGTVVHGLMVLAGH
jgi:hypothetical protein